MLNLLELALNNNYVYIGIIIILIIIIIITILSIKKDRDEAIKARRKALEKPTEEMKKAKLELETVVNEMQKKLDMKENFTRNTYEEEQEEKAIISYQELVDSIKKEPTPHSEVGMEVADINVVENVKPSIEELTEYEVNETIEEKEMPKKETKFKNSEFISPIYGVNKKTKEVKKEESITNGKAFVMDDIIDEDFDEEDEFLDSLKDFRKKL